MTRVCICSRESTEEGMFGVRVCVCVSEYVLEDGKECVLPGAGMRKIMEA